MEWVSNCLFNDVNCVQLYTNVCTQNKKKKQETTLKVATYA